MGKRVITGPEPYEMEPEEEARVEAAIEQSERDLAAMAAQGRWGFSDEAIPVEGPGAEEARVNMPWGKTQLAVVKRAAELFGMPYQTYIRQAAFRQALDDLHKLQAISGLKGEAA